MAKGIKRGFSSINNQLNFVDSNSVESKLIQRIQKVEDQFIYARVVDIILDDTHPLFESSGGITSIGTIFIKSVENSSTLLSDSETAIPLIPYLKNYPLVNEFVILFKCPSTQIITKESNTEIYYYLNPISLWNNQHLNAYPSETLNSNTQPSEDKSYQAIEEGQTRKSSNKEVNYDYNSPLAGGTFIERSNIHPLLAYAGDIIVEGRWGNSIRFGSTVKSNSIIYTNNWSDNGENGNPIIIIRNGQSEKSNQTAGYFPVVEDINLDLSSIYLTSNQTIPLITTITNNPSIKNNKPESIGSFINSQIILNSNRLVFNANSTGSILLNSEGTISLTSINTIGLYSQQGDVVLQSAKNSIKLGDANANESLVLGDTFLDDFEDLLKKLQTLAQNLSTEPRLTTSPPAAGSLKTKVSEMLDSINNYKSKIVKAI